MLAITEMGGIVFPPVPAFYNAPATIADMVDHTLSRVLDLFGLETGLGGRWTGKPAAPKQTTTHNGDAR